MLERARAFAEKRVNLAESAVSQALRSTATANANLASALEALQVASSTHSIDARYPKAPPGAAAVDLTAVATCGACGQPLKDGQLASHVSSLRTAVDNAKSEAEAAIASERSAVESARAASSLQRSVLRVIYTHKMVKSAQEELRRLQLESTAAGTAAEAEANAATEARNRAVAASEEVQMAREAAMAAAAADAWQKEAAASERAAAMWRAERRGRLAFEGSCMRSILVKEN